MNQADLDAVGACLERLPPLRGAAAAELELERLGGLTNLVYRVGHRGEQYLLRIPGEGTAQYIDRAVEAHNAQVAADAGVSAAVLFSDPGDGLLLTRYLGGCATMSPERFRTTPGAPARAARALRRMHDWSAPFRFRFELFAMIDDYLAVLEKLGASLPDGYHEVVAEAGDVRAALDAHPALLAPCHCDPLAENFLDDGARMWIVDWEYSGMNDPLWDLGDLSVEAGFGTAHDEQMLAAYCDGEPPPATLGRVVVYKAMCDLLWTLWGLIQHANDNPAEDFWAYSVNRFERCQQLMGGAEFARHLAAVARG